MQGQERGRWVSACRPDQMKIALTFDSAGSVPIIYNRS